MLKRNILANYVGTAWNAVMGIAFVPVYVKYLGTEAYGVIGISAVIGSFLSFFDLGLSPMLSREVARYKGGVHAAESIRSPALRRRSTTRSHLACVSSAHRWTDEGDPVRVKRIG